MQDTTLTLGGDNISMFSISGQCFNGKVLKENLEQLKDPYADLNMNIVNNNTKVTNDYYINKRLVSESFAEKYGSSILTEAKDDNKTVNVTNNYPNVNAVDQTKSTTVNNTYDKMNQSRNTITNNKYDKMDQSKNTTINNTYDKMNQSKNNITNNKYDKMDQSKHNTTYNTSNITNLDKDYGKDKIELPRDVLKWTQTQKLNELMPTTLVIKLVGSDKDSGLVVDREFILGVKTTLHPIDSDEMVDNLVAACQNKGVIFRFIKWTTGEISFFKDFLFNVKEIKDDVIKRSAGYSPWWIALKRRKTISTIKSWFSSKSILPNSTIVVSMEEVAYIKSQFGFDLTDVNFVNNIMETYFLLGFVIVDNSIQIAHFLFDGQSTFASHSFKGLEKEGERKDDLKEMLKLVNRVY
jgi:hypothetical protein